MAGNTPLDIGKTTAMISGSTRLLGVWGYPVGHSRSPQIHNAALQAIGLDWVYVPFTVPPDGIADAVRALRVFNIVGVNVTVPLKEAVIEHLDSVDPDAQIVGSVNTIANNNGSLRGFSTDGAGLLWDLKDQGLLPDSGQPVFVWGAGGSAKAVVHAINLHGCPVTVVNRNMDRAQELRSLLPGDITVYPSGSKEADQAACTAALLINTTSLGMSPHSDAMPHLPLHPLRNDSVVYDVIYSPENTRLMQAAAARGVRVSNGLGMLVRQAALSLSIWSGLTTFELPIKVMEQAARVPNAAPS